MSEEESENAKDEMEEEEESEGKNEGEEKEEEEGEASEEKNDNEKVIKIKDNKKNILNLYEEFSERIKSESYFFIKNQEIQNLIKAIYKISEKIMKLIYARSKKLR